MSLTELQTLILPCISWYFQAKPNLRISGIRLEEKHESMTENLKTASKKKEHFQVAIPWHVALLLVLVTTIRLYSAVRKLSEHFI